MRFGLVDGGFPKAPLSVLLKEISASARTYSNTPPQPSIRSGYRPGTDSPITLPSSDPNTASSPGVHSIVRVGEEMVPELGYLMYIAQGAL